MSKDQDAEECTLKSRSWLSLCFSVTLVIGLLTLPVVAQTSLTDGRTPLGMTPGGPAGSYSLSDLDNVNLFNGNLSFRIPLLTIGGRGSAGYTMTLRPNENRFNWRVIHNIQRTCGQFGCTVTGHTYYPSINWWATTSNQPGYTPGVLVGRKSGEDPGTPAGCPNGTNVWGSTLTRITFSSGDGTEYELRDQQRSGQPQPLPGGTCGGQASLRGKVFVTGDGSSATFISDSDIYDSAWVNSETFYPSGYLLLRDGTRYRIDSGSVSWIRDRNGNKITFSTNGTITDSLKRTVTYSSGAPDVITFKGFGGATRTIQISRVSLSTALRPCRSDPGYQCFSIQTYKQLFPNSDGSSVTQFNPDVVSAITLPDGRQYRFYYNSYAELARVDLPTGGVIEYDYAGAAGGDSSGLTGAVVGLYEEKAILRRVVERRVYADGQTLEGRTTYGIANPTVVDHLKPTGEVISREQHYFYGDPRATLFTGANSYGWWNDGKEYKTQLFDNDGTTELRRVENTWQQGCSVSSWSTSVPNNPRIADTTSTLEPSSANKVSKEVFGYDCYNNLTDKYEYDFGTGTPAASYTRRTHTDYLTINPINGAAYDTLNPSSTNPDINASYHLRNLPRQTSVFDGGGTERQRTVVEYDNYATDAGHASLFPRSNISSLCTVITSPTSCDNVAATDFQKRGNVTAVTATIFVNGTITGSVSSYSQYDIAGNVVKAIDGLGHSTNIFYDDVFGAPNGNARLNTAPAELAGEVTFALPTKITNALGQSVYAQFDYYLAKPVDAEDLNGVVSSGYFNDPLDRPTQIRRAVGTLLENQSTFAYDDTNRVITTTGDRDANNDNILKTQLLYDMMGRTIETRQYEGGTNYIVSQTQYDALGRAYKTSNPYRPWQSESALWTTQTFDALGRVKSVTTPDNGVVTTDYAGNAVTVTDQAGKKRKSVTDALGRLVQVYEDPGGRDYLTSYSYDSLDNLTTVTQDTQQRFFMYDSLQRLIRSRNPEQAVRTPQLDLSDATTGNGQWSVAYVYDNANNLTQKTDARLVAANYIYDALNRVTTVDYSDTTPDVRRFYDGATIGIGRFWYAVKGDEAAANNVEKTSVDSYDALGRPLVQQQSFKLNGAWNPYQTTRTYNLAGGVVTQTYPSNHSVSYAYDSAGRLTSFSGTLGDGTTRTYSTGIDYDPFGGVRQEQFGTQVPLYHKNHYNRRGQLFDIRLSTVPWATNQWNWNRGAIINYYSANYAWEGDTPAGPDNNGNVLLQQHWVPADDAISSYSYTQDVYAYDSLNRIQSVVEYHATPAGQSAQDFAQVFAYDRWGNRTIDPTSWGVGINTKQFAANPATNRLEVPGGQPGVMSYDNAGNLTTDTYTGVGTRTYDAENRMITAADNTGQTSRYTYDADGHRVRRQIASSQEEWQIYGMDGELLAEYRASSPASGPEKEYGYRNGQLLITATGRLNVALAANGGVATASTAHTCCGFSTTGAINGNYRGPWGNGEGWNDATPDQLPDWFQVDFAGSKSIDEIDVFSLHDNYTQENTPTETQTFSLYGLINFEVQYWNGSSWVTIPGGSVTGNNKVWRKFTFAPVTTSKIRLWITSVPDSWSRLVELQAWGTGAGGAEVRWLVTDHLGTPRMIVDQAGTLASVKRHDYLPFGEELFAGTGGRSTALGYSLGDTVRQQFTSKERDIETGLDFLEARYFASLQGRFISVDPVMSSARPLIPQSWNRYAYCINNPLKFIDPNGLDWYTKEGGDGHPEWFDKDPGRKYKKYNNTVYYAGAKWGYVSLDPNSKNWEYGFQTEDQARAYYINSMGACDAHCRGHAERELTWQNDPPFGGNDTAVDATSFGMTFPVGGPVGGVAREAVTRTVWDSMVATQEVYEGTVIPRSFELTTEGAGKVWVSGNATEHLVEFVAGRTAMMTPEATRLVSQVQLANLQGAINAAGRMGIKYGELMNVGRWELVFAPPRAQGQLPAVIHALYK